MVTAARGDAVASSSLKLCYILVLIYYFFTFITEAHITYDRNTLINVGKGSAGIGLSTADLETITTHNILRPAGPNASASDAIAPGRELE